jgi:hypothetical protein
MSTRSNIAVQLKDSTKVKVVYCHCDGYIQGVGKTLVENYKSYDDAISLLQFGGISSLGNNLKETSFYSRDWGRKDDNCTEYQNEFQFMYDMTGSTMIEYIYLFKDNKWFVSTSTYIPSKKLKNAYDIGLNYWTKFIPVDSHKDFFIKSNGITEKQMISSLGQLLTNSFGGENLIVQGQSKKGLN